MRRFFRLNEIIGNVQEVRLWPILPDSVIIQDPEIHKRRARLPRQRAVPFQTLLDYPRGWRKKRWMNSWHNTPGVSREQAIAALEEAKKH